MQTSYKEKILREIEAELEMHDRLIVTTALHYEASLITKDVILLKSGIVQTVW